MTRQRAINDLSTLKAFFEEEGDAYPVSLVCAIKSLKAWDEVIAEIQYELDNPDGDYSEIEKGLKIAMTIIGMKLKEVES